MKNIEYIEQYFRAANYLSAAQLYLKDNFLLEYPLKKEHLKTRFFGHWGTSPGLNFIYAHLNNFINNFCEHSILVVGAGHAAASLYANLFLEGSLKTILNYKSVNLGNKVFEEALPYNYLYRAFDRSDDYISRRQG